MISSVKVILTVVTVVAMCVSGPVSATDFVWDGNGPLAEPSDPRLWDNENHWTADSGYPQTSSDTATLADVAPGDTCTFDDSEGVIIDELTITGDSPTRMTLDIVGGYLNFTNLYLNDYAQVKYGGGITSGVSDLTTISGNVWMDVDGGSIDLGEEVRVDGTQTVWTIDVEEGAVAPIFHKLNIDADTVGEQRALKVAGEIRLTTELPYGNIFVRSDPDADNRRAKFWFASGSITFGNNTYLVADGGDSPARRVELDIDENLALDATNCSSTFSGHVGIDIAAGKQFDGQRINITGPSVIKVTSGANGSFVSSHGPSQ